MTMMRLQQLWLLLLVVPVAAADGFDEDVTMATGEERALAMTAHDDYYYNYEHFDDYLAYTKGKGKGKGMAMMGMMSSKGKGGMSMGMGKGKGYYYDSKGKGVREY